MLNWLRNLVGTAGAVAPEEADRIAVAYFAEWRYPAAYRIIRAAELPELRKFYYRPKWNLPGAPPQDAWRDIPLGFGGFFVSLRTGEVESIGSGRLLGASCYLRARDWLSPNDEPSDQG